MKAGELQIVKLVKSGTVVKPGDVVVEFDGSTLLRTIQEKQSELKQADAEIEQSQAQSRITNEQNATALMRAKYDLQRAKLDVDQGRHRLPHRERAGEAHRARRGAEAAASSRRRSSRTRPGAEADVSGKRQQAREGAVRPAARRAGPQEPAAQGAGRRHGQRAAEFPLRRHVRQPGRSFAKGIGPGPARRFSSCPTCRPSTSRRGSTSPTAGASKQGQDATRPD